MLKNEKDVLELIEQDEWMMELLRAVNKLDLPDCWVCAGVVRSKIWDTLHGFTERTLLQDVDVIYYDKSHVCEEDEKRIEARLNDMVSGIPWSVKNQARMHIRNHVEPYTSSIDAMTKFPETATALGVKMDVHGRLVLCAPHGVEDVCTLQVRPSPYFKTSLTLLRTYEKRMEKKEWKRSWPKLQMMHVDEQHSTPIEKALDF